MVTTDPRFPLQVVSTIIWSILWILVRFVGQGIGIGSHLEMGYLQGQIIASLGLLQFWGRQVVRTVPACSSNSTHFTEAGGGCPVWVQSSTPLPECPGTWALPVLAWSLKWDCGGVGGYRGERSPAEHGRGAWGRCWRGKKISIWLFQLLATSLEHSHLAALLVPDP